jgi:hypothetical protein
LITTNEWLPIGSVVHVPEYGERLLCIIGCMQTDVETGKLWDYVALEFPVGYTDRDKMIMFDKNSIDCIYFLGYQDTDGMVFQSIVQLNEKSFEAAKEKEKEH